MTRLRNDGKGYFQTFCEAIKVDSKTYCEKIKRKRFPHDYTENTHENFLPPCGGGLRWGEDGFHHPHPSPPPSQGEGSFFIVCGWRGRNGELRSQCPAVHINALAGDEAGGIRRQEKDGADDFLGFGQPALGDRHGHVLGDFRI